MDNTREKLIELLDQTVAECMPSECIDEIADHLIANGVTIPVRCKDCDNTCPGQSGIICTIWGAGTEPDAFCSHGERKE